MKIAATIGLIALLGAPCSGIAQESIVGIASVIDGDTLEIHGQRIRLFGIDAPEGGQLCMRPNGERWRCARIGSDARRSVASHATLIAIVASLPSVSRDTKT